MEAFKVEHYEREHGQGTFPAWRRLESLELQELRYRLTQALNIPRAASGREIVQAVQDRSRPVDGVSAEAKGCDLGQVLSQFGLSAADSVYINWSTYDNVDEIRTADMMACFDDIWYPSSDDIDVFDQSMTWIASVAHYGVVSVARLPGGMV